MKPIFLSMQAFGPFATMQTINFQSLGENPLFLINGPTGAGKSTILDAISFALYGESTGKERDPVSMRCDLSDTDTPTEVIFDFNLSGDIYRIIRRPAQELAKAKGVGTTTKGPKVTVYRHRNANLHDYRFDEDANDVELLPLKGVKEVNEWIRGLTGLSSEQFRQVMVLPQGQFRKLLLAESDQRENIFSQLFQTHIYKKIEEQLKLKSADLRNTRKSLTENVVGLLDSVELTEQTELNEKLAQIEPAYKKATLALEGEQAKLLAADKTLQQAKAAADKFSELATLELKISDLKRQEIAVNQLIKDIERSEQARKIQPLQLQLQADKKRLEAELKQKETIDNQLVTLVDAHEIERKNFKAIEPQWLELEARKQELSSWEHKKTLLVGLNQEQVRNKSLAQSIAQAEESIQQQQLAKSNLNQTLANISERINIDTQALARMPEIQADFEKFDRLGRDRKNLAELVNTTQNLTIEAQQISESLEQLNNQKKIDQTKLKEVELSWHQGQAFELAKQLEQGVPCIVCGSREHPHPANDADVTYANKEHVDQARIQVQATQDQVNRTETQLHSIQYQINESNQRIVKSSNDLGEYKSQPIEWFREQWQQCKGELTKLKGIQEQQPGLVIQQQQCSEQIQESDTQITVLVEKRDAIKLEQAACLARIDERQHEIPSEFRNIKSLDDQINLLSKHIKDVTESHQNSLNRLQQFEQQLTAQNSLLNNVIERINKQTKQVAGLTAQWSSALKDSGFNSDADYIEACWSDEYLAKQKTIVDTHKTTRADLNTRKNYICSELKDVDKPDLIGLQEQVDIARAKQTEAAEQLTALTSEFESLKRVAKRLSKIQHQVDEVENEYKIIGTLADAASGLTGNRVSLQRYVLGVLLDDVLNEASQRLQLMSKGRYRLIRKLDRSKGNKTSGLELEIEDAYSGGQRPANTLSGGESFMAALSLALGLSDVVQSYSGGVKLETLFIDEGFGSLDMESLELAIQTLIDLRKSGRTIGIISHVSELKEQITQRIDVTTSDQGSSVKVVHI